MTDAIGFETDASERAVLTAKGTFEKVVVKRHGTVVRTYTRLKSIDAARLKWARTKEEPPAPDKLGAEVGSQEYESMSAGGPTTQESKIEKGTSWDLGAEVRVWGSGFKLGGKSTYERDVTNVNKLPKGKGYKATRYASFPARIWEVI